MTWFEAYQLGTIGKNAKVATPKSQAYDAILRFSRSG
jgi:hypothetical protein